VAWIDEDGSTIRVPNSFVGHCRRHDHLPMPDLPTARALAEAFRRFDADASQHVAILRSPAAPDQA
jgi:hypothetical protein